MLRLILIFFVFFVAGLMLLSSHSPELAGNLVVFVFTIGLGIVAVVLGMHFYLDKQKDDEDRESYTNVLDEPKVKSFTDIKAFSRAMRKRSGRR